MVNIFNHINVTSEINMSNSSDENWGSVLSSDDCGDNINDIFGIPNIVRSTSYLILDEYSLQCQYNQIIDQIASECFVPRAHASSLLRYYRWDSQKLLNDWLSNQKVVRIKVGIPLNNLTRQQSSKSHKIKSISSNQNDTVKCSTAFCGTVKINKAFSLHCGHYFCFNCWTMFLTMEVQNGKTCLYTKCPGFECSSKDDKSSCKCNLVVSDEVFFMFLENENLERYKKWLLELFVDGCQNIRFCPNPNCTNAILYHSKGNLEVECSCCEIFCFGCGDEPHRPAPCEIARRWVRKSTSEDETDTWIKARTRPCPKCKVRIEKNRYCNHMICTNCNHHFCWLCLEDWSKHDVERYGWYNCSKYEKEIERGQNPFVEEKMQIEAQIKLQKYQFYFNRFIHQRQGAKEAEIFLNRAKEMALNLFFNEEQKCACRNVVDAAKVVKRSREILSWTFVLGYYFKQSPEKILFEFQQGLLEGHTEKLHELMQLAEEEHISTSRNHSFAAEHFKNYGEIDYLTEKSSEIISRAKVIQKVYDDFLSRVEGGELDYILLDSADTAMDNWACTLCTSENNASKTDCTVCLACRKHGEQQCKACHRFKYEINP